MKKALLVGAIFSSLGTALATNGDNLIGLTPASRAMGGIGVGMPVGPVDSLFRNPAWMSVMENKFTAQFGGILFMPRVKGRYKHPNLGDSGYVDSKANLFVVPEIGLVHRLSDRLVFGLGAFGVSGMGVDYRNQDQRLSNMRTTFQFMRIIPAIAYQINDVITVSGAVHGAWGSLSMGATMMCDTNNDGQPDDCNMNGTSLDDVWNAGGGQSQSLGIGFQVGASLNFGDFLYAGITYQSPVSMTYRRVFDSDNDDKFEDLKLEQPQEVAVGLGAAPLDSLRVGLDIRWINWKDADGYGDFQWDDQWVFALGVEYKPTEKLALRVGYNFGESPIKGGDKSTARPANPNIPDLAAPFSDFHIAWFNLIGFPAITEHHLTLGVGYEFTKTFSLDVSYVRAFEKTVEACAQGTSCGVLVGAKNVQDSVSVGASWRF